MKILLLLTLIIIISISSALKEEEMLNGLLILRPELQPTVKAAVDIYADHLFGAQPFFIQYFGPQNETLSNVLQIFDYAQFTPEVIDQAFLALELNYTNLVNFTMQYPPTHSYFLDCGHPVKIILAIMNLRINNYAKYAQLVTDCGLPATISFAPWTMTDVEVFDILTTGDYSETNYNNITASLNFTGISELLTTFNVNRSVVETFIVDYSDNFMEILETLDIKGDQLKTALNILAPSGFLLDHTIVKGLQTFFEGRTAFGSFLQPFKVLTHNSSEFLDVYRNLQEYTDLWGIFPPTGNKYHMIINETQRGWMNELNVLDSQNVGKYQYNIERTYNTNSYAQCNYPYFISLTDWTIGFDLQSAAYHEDDKTLNLPKLGAQEIRDGTPLICRDSLYGIGSLNRSIDKNDWIFDAVATFEKVIDVMEPIVDVAVETIKLAVGVATMTNATDISALPSIPTIG